MAWEGIDGYAEAIGADCDEAYRRRDGRRAAAADERAADVAGTVAWLLSDGRARRHRPGDRPERRAWVAIFGGGGKKKC